MSQLRLEAIPHLAERDVWTSSSSSDALDLAGASSSSGADS